MHQHIIRYLSVLTVLCPLSANSSALAAPEQPENPCNDAQGIMGTACEEARKLLLEEPAGGRSVTTVRVSLGAQGWRYRFEDITQETCPDKGDITMPQGGQLQIVSTSDDKLYDWSVEALGIETALIPGRLETIMIDAKDASKYPGVISSTSVSGSVQILAPEHFIAWRAALQKRSC
ncbi:hypothetical protein ACWGNA_24630 [Brucella cytisi]|uniref:hypothetical protein n=1 Tax=Brucella cytisi TaxID=407152 RepID=UPI0035DF76A5